MAVKNVSKKVAKKRKPAKKKLKLKMLITAAGFGRVRKSGTVSRFVIKGDLSEEQVTQFFAVGQACQRADRIPVVLELVMPSKGK